MTLTGALPRIQYLFKPDINKIFTKKCWQDAATQTFFNLGLGKFPLRKTVSCSKERKYES